MPALFSRAEADETLAIERAAQERELADEERGLAAIVRAGTCVAVYAEDDVEGNLYYLVKVSACVTGCVFQCLGVCRSPDASASCAHTLPCPPPPPTARPPAPCARWSGPRWTTSSRSFGAATRWWTVRGEAGSHWGGRSCGRTQGRPGGSHPQHLAPRHCSSLFFSPQPAPPPGAGNYYDYVVSSTGRWDKASRPYYLQRDRRCLLPASSLLMVDLPLAPRPRVRGRAARGHLWERGGPQRLPACLPACPESMGADC